MNADLRTPQEWEEAAARGDAAAQTMMGLMYAEGEGVPRSYEKAVEWFRKAAEQGHFDAQYNLGYMYDNGYGVAQSYEQAAYWYRKAAEQGDQHAQNNLGDMYDMGQGVSKDHVQAARWYRKAAERGDAYAQHRLGEILERYDGDVAQAYAWYKVAATHEYPGADYDAKSIALDMSPEQLSAATALAYSLARQFGSRRARTADAELPRHAPLAEP